MNRWGTTALASLICLTAHADAQSTLEQAEVLYDIGNKVAAIEAYRILAFKGNSEAQLRLGSLAPDRAERLKWLREQATKGSIGAQSQLAMELANEPATQAEAKTWYTKVFNSYLQQAQAGDPGAQEEVAYLYERGIGVPPNPLEARRWQAATLITRRKQAQSGNLESQEWMVNRSFPGKTDEEASLWLPKVTAAHLQQAERGSLTDQLWLGEHFTYGVNKPLEAIRWYERAIAAGSVVAMLELANLYKGQADLGEEEEQIQEAYLNAYRWYETAASRGSATALAELAGMHYHGDGVRRDLPAAAKLYLAANKQNKTTALFELGRLYYYGEGVSVNHAEALRYYTLSANNYDHQGALEAALMHASGEGTPKNVTEARRWLSVASTYASPGMLVRLGQIYLSDDVIPHDYALALKAFQEAGESATALFYLGVMYHEGHGVPASSFKAVQWWRLAAEKEYADAAYHLGLAYFEGDGVSKDYRESARWWLKVTELEGEYVALLYGKCTCTAEAKYRLGSLYHSGLGVQQDLQEARRWWQSAANQGHPQAIEALKQP